jgi:uncharacterized membrane-anchored protein
VELTSDSAGYAKILEVTKSEPVDIDEYVKANINYIITDTLSTVFISYPFDRFYMEESKAPDAQQAYNESAIDTNQVAYALVLVKHGEAVVKDVMIDDVPIRELIKRQQSNPK